MPRRAYWLLRCRHCGHNTRHTEERAQAGIKDDEMREAFRLAVTPGSLPMDAYLKIRIAFVRAARLLKP